MAHYRLQSRASPHFIKLVTAALYAGIIVLPALGCSGGVLVRKRVTLPAAVPELRRPVRIAVISRQDAFSDVMRTWARRALIANADASLPGPGVMNAVERVYQTQGIRPAMAVAQQAGVEIVVRTGSTERYAKDLTTLPLRKCLATSTQGKKRTCLRWSGTYRRLTEKCEATVTLSFVDVARARVIDTVEIGAETKRTSANYGSNPTGDKGLLCKKAVETTQAAFRPYLLPTDFTLRLNFRHVDDGVGATKEALAGLQRGDDRKAAELFPEIPAELQDPEQRGLAWYNYGLLLWSQLDFKGCHSAVRKAQSTLGNTEEIRALRLRCDMYHRPRS